MSRITSHQHLNPFTAFGKPVPGTEISWDPEATIPFWQLVGYFYTTAENELYPRNPAIERACREFDPSLIFLWVNIVYKRPQDDSASWEYKCFGRHAIAKHVPNPVHPHEPFKGILRGLRDTKPPPNVLVEILEDNRPWMREENSPELPGKYIPFDWFIYHGLRQNFINPNIKADAPDKQALKDRREAAKVENEKWSEEWKRDTEEFSRTFVQPRLDAAADREIRNFMMRNKLGIKDKAPKPYAFLKGA